MNICQSPVIFIPGSVNTNHRGRGRAIPVGNGKWTAMVYSHPDYEKWQKRFRLLYLAAGNFVLPDDLPAFRIYLCFVVPAIVMGTQERNGKVTPVRRRYKADVDNLEKSVIDALQGLAYKNDSGAIPLPFPDRMDEFNPWVEVVDHEDKSGVRLQFEYKTIAVQTKISLKDDF